MNEHLKYGLPGTDIDNVISILQRNPKVNKIVLFGSRAKGSFTNGSDVDIALMGQELSLNDILDVSIEIEKLSLPYKFDIIIYERVKEKALTEHINRVGIVLYQRGVCISG